MDMLPQGKRNPQDRIPRLSLYHFQPVRRTCYPQLCSHTRSGVPGQRISSIGRDTAGDPVACCIPCSTPFSLKRDNKLGRGWGKGGGRKESIMSADTCTLCETLYAYSYGNNASYRRLNDLVALGLPLAPPSCCFVLFIVTIDCRLSLANRWKPNTPVFFRISEQLSGSSRCHGHAVTK